MSDPGGAPATSARYRYGALLIGGIAGTACLELWLTKGAPTVLVIGFLAIACAVETAGMLRAARCDPYAKASVPLAIAVVLVHTISHLEQSFSPSSPLAFARGLRTADLGLAGFLMFCIVCVLRRKTDDAAQVLGGGAIVLLVPTCILYVVDIRYYGGAPEPAGLALVLFLVSISKLGDIAAYVVGSAVGRHKLIPAVSPKKTWEGAIASLLASVGLAAVLATVHLAGGLSAERAIAAGVVINISSQFGDLTESLLKRAGGLKDSGHWIPQFGGAFDLVDSLFLAAPMFYGFLRFAA
jgi:phosphatidate cytidylyltransferase